MVMSEIFSPDVLTSNIFGLSETLIIYLFIYRPDGQSRYRPCQRTAMVCVMTRIRVSCSESSDVYAGKIDRFID